MAGETLKEIYQLGHQIEHSIATSIANEQAQSAETHTAQLEQRGSDIAQDLRNTIAGERRGG